MSLPDTYDLSPITSIGCFSAALCSSAALCVQKGSRIQVLVVRFKLYVNSQYRYIPGRLLIDDSRFTFHEGSGCYVFTSHFALRTSYFKIDPFTHSPPGRLFIDDSRFTFHEGGGCYVFTSHFTLRTSYFKSCPYKVAYKGSQLFAN
jgi:hypothetical protein